MNIVLTFTISFLLIIVGVGIIASNTYQELVEEETVDYHMGPITRRYEWRTKNHVLAALGGVLLAIGLVILAYSFIDVIFYD